MRSLALKYGATLIYTSSKLKSNLETLIDYLSYVLLDKTNVKLKVQLNNEDLFIPVGFDQLDILQDRFKDSMDFFFERASTDLGAKKKMEQQETEKVLDIQEFLANLKNGKMIYFNTNIKEKNRLLQSKKNPPLANKKRSIFSDSTSKIMQILERKKKT